MGSVGLYAKTTFLPNSTNYSLTYIGSINLCVLCVFVVRSRLSLGGMYLRIHFTHQIQESRENNH
ncbi:MAG: hypothetical protein EWV73_07945 [Microcystis wesenbergii Mw_QC_B_20070930_S4D]|nr:MAG: hypothetical protein EWV73_07945 [Microcystis wesenbergii Mw_QC_B_20070930_S4D]